MLLSRKIISKLFYATTNTQLRKIRVKERLKTSLILVTQVVFLYFTVNRVRFHFGQLLKLSFQIYPSGRFFNTSFNQVWSGSTIAPAASIIVWQKYQAFNGSENFVS